MRKINTRSFVRATRATPREINRQIVLNLVREHQPISRADLVAEIARRIRGLLDTHAANGRCEGIGVAVPGMVDHRTGRVLNAPQLGWRDVDIRDALARATGLPVQIENAPVACALAHMWLGARGGEATGDFAYVTISDGVGVGAVINGDVVRGHDNTAGEFGHVALSFDGPPCFCGARGCFEAYASNIATLSRYLGEELTPTAIRGVLHSTGLTVSEVIARARAGDYRAISAIDATARYLGAGLSMVIAALNPSQIFLGGEITEAWDRIEPIVRKVITERALTPAAAATPIYPDPPTSFPRLRGATALVTAPMFAAPRVA